MIISDHGDGIKGYCRYCKTEQAALQRHVRGHIATALLAREIHADGTSDACRFMHDTLDFDRHRERCGDPLPT